MHSDPELPSIAEMSRIRADVYAFLSEAFLEEPDEVTLDRLAERAQADELEFVPEAVRDETSNADAFDGTNLLQEVGREVRDLDAAEREDFREDLAAEYASLFLTAGSKQVNPYQSFYLGDEGILYQEETLKLKEIMQELGYEAAEENAEPEDHSPDDVAEITKCRPAEIKIAQSYPVEPYVDKSDHNDSGVERYEKPQVRQGWSGFAGLDSEPPDCGWERHESQGNQHQSETKDGD